MPENVCSKYLDIILFLWSKTEKVIMDGKIIETPELLTKAQEVD